MSKPTISRPTVVETLPLVALVDEERAQHQVRRRVGRRRRLIENEEASGRLTADAASLSTCRVDNEAAEDGAAVGFRA